MSKLSLIYLIGLIIHHISCLNIPTPQEQFGPEKTTGIFDPSGPLQQLFGMQKNLRSEGCWPKKLCQSQEDCGTDGICYISYEDPYLGKIRFLSKRVFLTKVPFDP